MASRFRERVARVVRGRDAKSQLPPLYFLHIMKTGGTALTTALAQINNSHASVSVTDLFLDQFVTRDAEQWRAVGFVTGHLPWEARELLPADTRTLTVLRDPVDRTLSHYWQLSVNPDVLAESPGFSLEEFVDSPRWNTLCRDYQARQLAHRVDLANAGKTYAPAGAWAKVKKDQADRMVAKFNATAAPADVTGSGDDGRPTDVWIAFLVPSGTHVKEFKVSGKTAAKIDQAVP